MHERLDSDGSLKDESSYFCLLHRQTDQVSGVPQKQKRPEREKRTDP